MPKALGSNSSNKKEKKRKENKQTNKNRFGVWLNE
jgi:hypothetical protein